MIAGESVAKGYLGACKESSFIIYNNKKAYLTGDLGYFKNGVLYYKERIDKQIKYKGYRIELSDIENTILNLNYIDKAKVVAKKDEEERILNIIAFIILRDNSKKTESDIRKDLCIKLPEYMRPKIKIVNQFPINKNGKCDEKKLLEAD